MIPKALYTDERGTAFGQLRIVYKITALEITAAIIELIGEESKVTPKSIGETLRTGLFIDGNEYANNVASRYSSIVFTEQERARKLAKKMFPDYFDD